MKMLAVLSFVLGLSPTFAAEEFGGVKFHSTVDKKQSSALKNDLKYLYQNPVASPDKEFLSTGAVSVGDGPNMHNWLLNRVRYIVGEKYELTNANIVAIPGKFPSTPLPDIGSEPKALSVGSEGDADESGVKTVMSNLGSALYVMGKFEGLFLGIKFDNENVFAKSSRVGILQVGEGLFLKRFMLNNNVNSPANSIFRLSTLFHEARHSDGNGKNTGFMHAYCPKGHSYGGFAACEVSGNGSYTIGALAQRNLLKSCGSCTTEEKSILAAGVVDSFSRIVDLSKNNKLNDLKELINTYTLIKETYEDIHKSSVLIDGVKFAVEIEKIKIEIDRLRDEMNLLAQSSTKKPVFLDANPEGEWTPISLKDSMRAMERSIKK